MAGRTARPDSPGRAVSLVGVLALVCLVLWTPVTGAAQDVHVAGTVVDVESGVPVVAATVRVILFPRGRGPEARTGADGGFRVLVPSGRYALLVERHGYETLRLDRVKTPRPDAPWVLRLTPTIAVADPLITAPDRSRLERVSSGVTSVSVVRAGDARSWGAFTPADLLEGLPGAGTLWTGLSGRTLVGRGFNDVFSDGPLVLEDERPVQMPSSRTHAFQLISSTLLDVGRVEFLRGPASALYGANAAAGVARIVTSSPIDEPGTRVSLAAGERSLFHGSLHQAVRFSERSGMRVSGRFLRGLNWPVSDVQEGEARSLRAESGGGEIRFDVRPWSDGEVVLAAGVSRMQGSVLFRRDGPVEARGWTQAFGQARVKKGRLFAQGFVNQGDAGSSVDLRTGAAVVDHSSMVAAQVQYGRELHPLIDVTGGLDLSRTTPGTDGTVHGRWETNDDITQVGGYVYGVARPVDRARIVAALRVDDHSRFDEVRFSPRVGVVVDAAPNATIHAAVNRGYTYPTPDLLFSDRITGRIPLLDTLGFDVRVMGLPDQALTFTDRCPGGMDDRCMFSPLLPGIRVPATGAALWDAVLVPLALESETLRAALAGMGLSPNGFAEIIGRPGPADLASRLVRWTGDEAGKVFEDAPAGGSVARLRPTTTESVELGFRGSSGGRLSYSVDVHATRVSDLVGPLAVATSTLFLDRSSVEAFLLKRMIAVGVPSGVADRIAQGIAATTSSVPLGTLAPDQLQGPDVVLAYRNLGSVRLWGADVGARWQVAPRVTLLGSLTYLSANCFDLDTDGVCGSVGDATLNSPSLLSSATARWHDPVMGVTLAGRVRYADAFPVNAGVYRGVIPGRTLVDVDGRFLLPWAPGAAISVTVTNVLDRAHHDFIGAPDQGRLALVTVQYAF